ncbi:MAG TPA: hypothetical protein VK205_15660 [Prolixibacteraceae bacterium]|nr:hypothetical protein [Prolixibacteraceae bacterium]
MAKVLMIKVMNFPGELRFPKAHFSFSFKKMQSQGGAALSKSAFFIFRFKKNAVTDRSSPVAPLHRCIVARLHAFFFVQPSIFLCYTFFNK